MEIRLKVTIRKSKIVYRDIYYCIIYTGFILFCTII